MLSALTAIFQEFKENCNVTHSIITYSRKKDEFLIYIYALQKDIKIENEENKLLALCYKHGICYENNWGNNQIILVRSTYCSTYVFFFLDLICNFYFFTPRKN